jgi:hypothetical protein
VQSQEQHSYSPHLQSQRGATLTSVEPASVIYARQRNSMLSNSAISNSAASNSAVSTTSYGSSAAQIVHVAQYPQPLSLTQPLTQQSLRVQNPSIKPAPHASTSRPNLLRPTNDTEEIEEGGSLLAYDRNSVASSDGGPESPASAYPPTLRHGTLPPQSSSKANTPPPLPETRVHQHEDGGPVLEVPPAYRDQYPYPKARPAEPK